MATCPSCGEIVMEGDPYCPNCGTTFIWNFDDEDDGRNDPPERQEPFTTKEDRLANEAWQLYMDYKDSEALEVINESLSLNPYSAKNWNTKAIILESLHRFEASKRCYDKSLELARQSIVYDNKARMIYAWSHELYNDDKDLEKGISLLSEVIEELSGHDCEEDVDKYRNSLDLFEKRVEELKNQSRILKEYEGNILITITGTSFYGRPHFKRGMTLTLKKEPDNEHDKHAIGVYHQDKKVGYVSNSDYTNADITMRAFFLKNHPDIMKAEFLFIYKHNYYIAAIIEE